MSCSVESCEYWASGFLFYITGNVQRGSRQNVSPSSDGEGGVVSTAQVSAMLQPRELDKDNNTLKSLQFRL